MDTATPHWPHGRPIGDTYCTDDRTFLEPHGPGYTPTTEETIAWMRAVAEYHDRIADASARAFDGAFRKAVRR